MPALHARRRQSSVQRLANRSFDHIDDLLAAARWYGEPVDMPSSAWTVDDVSIPNITDYSTVLTMARISANAYVEHPDDSRWQDVGNGFNYTQHFGWERDGIRGHVFADKTNSTIVIGIKGTTMAVFDGAESTTSDKLNDNLFFGCCCGRGGLFVRNFCDCQTDTYTCNTTCVTKALREKNRYYWAAMDLYKNVTALYPDSDIWFAGHSLGGSVASLVGMTFGLPAVTFEAPGEAMAAKRLGLPTPPGFRIGQVKHALEPHSYHFGHNADPLYLGTCGSICYVGGYAMESRCHSGHECVYNVTGDHGLGEHLNYHAIQYTIDNVLQLYKKAAACEVPVDCWDCASWKFFKSNSSDSTTTTSRPTSATYTQTRTETCKTPGWWGCLDETPSITATTTTSSSSTSTCRTPGWFGCNDPTSSTTTTTHSATNEQLPMTLHATLSGKIQHPAASPLLERASATARPLAKG